MSSKNSNDNGSKTGVTDIVSLLKENKRLKQENKELRVSLQSKTNQITTLQSKVQSNPREVSLQSLENEMAKYTKTKAYYQSIIDEFKTLKSKMSEMDLLHKQLAQCRETIALHQSQSREWIRNEQRLQSTVKELKAYNVDLKQRIKNRTKNSKQSQSMPSLLSNQFNDSMSPLKGLEAVDSLKSPVSPSKMEMDREQDQNDWIQLIIGRMKEVCFALLRSVTFHFVINSVFF